MKEEILRFDSPDPSASTVFPQGKEEDDGKDAPLSPIKWLASPWASPSEGNRTVVVRVRKGQGGQQ